MGQQMDIIRLRRATMADLGRPLHYVVEITWILRRRLCDRSVSSVSRRSGSSAKSSRRPKVSGASKRVIIPHPTIWFRESDGIHKIIVQNPIVINRVKYLGN